MHTVNCRLQAPTYKSYLPVINPSTIKKKSDYKHPLPPGYKPFQKWIKMIRFDMKFEV